MDTPVLVKQYKPGYPHSIMVNMLSYEVIVNEFELQYNHYVHFWTYTLGKGMNLLIPPAMG